MPETYTSRDVQLLQKTDKAVFIGYKLRKLWIPRSMLHAADDRKIDTWPLHTSINLRIFTWKAKELWQ